MKFTLQIGDWAMFYRKDDLSGAIDIAGFVAGINAAGDRYTVRVPGGKIRRVSRYERVAEVGFCPVDAMRRESPRW